MSLANKQTKGSPVAQKLVLVLEISKNHNKVYLLLQIIHEKCD